MICVLGHSGRLGPPVWCSSRCLSHQEAARWAGSAWCSVKHQQGPGGKCSQEWRRQHCGDGCLPLFPHGVGRHWHQRRTRNWPHCRGTAHLAGNLCAGHPRICYHHRQTMIHVFPWASVVGPDTGQMFVWMAEEQLVFCVERGLASPPLF